MSTACRILCSFFQIVTKVSDVYLVSLTAETRQLLSILSFTISVGMENTTSVLYYASTSTLHPRSTITWLLLAAGHRWLPLLVAAAGC